MNIVFYDGECPFCMQSIDFLLKRDRRRELHFAPLRGKLSTSLGFEKMGEDTVVFLEGEQVYTQFDAVCRIVQKLPFPWKGGALIRVIPSCIGNVLYQMVAKRRKQLSKNRVCTVLTKEEKSRFLE